MKGLLFLLSLTLGSVAWAQQALDGMKSDVVNSAPAAQGPGWMPMLNLLLVVGILFVLIKFGLPKLIAKATHRMHTGLDSSMRVEESATIGAGGLYVVQVRGKTLLIGSSANGSTQLIADLTESDQQERAEPAFFEVLDAASGAPDTEKEEARPHVSERLQRFIQGGQA